MEVCIKQLLSHFMQEKVKSQELRHGFPNVTKSGNAKMVPGFRSYISPIEFVRGPPPKKNNFTKRKLVLVKAGEALG